MFRYFFLWWSMCLLMPALANNASPRLLELKQNKTKYKNTVKYKNKSMSYRPWDKNFQQSTKIQSILLLIL